MFCLTVSEWIGLATAFATSLGVYIIWKQTSKLANQLTLQLFADYTKRYQDIMLNFPEDVNSHNFVLNGRKDYEHTMRYMRPYVDLCYEEWCLHTRKLIDNNTWKVWKGGIETAFTKPAFQQAWQVLKPDSEFDGTFKQFIEECIHGPLNSNR